MYEEDSDEEDAGGDELECHRDSPADRQARVDGLRNAVLAKQLGLVLRDLQV